MEELLHSLLCAWIKHQLQTGGGIGQGPTLSRSLTRKRERRQRQWGQTGAETCSSRQLVQVTGEWDPTSKADRSLQGPTAPSQPHGLGPVHTLTKTLCVSCRKKKLFSGWNSPFFKPQKPHVRTAVLNGLQGVNQKPSELKQKTFQPLNKESFLHIKMKNTAFSSWNCVEGVPFLYQFQYLGLLYTVVCIISNWTRGGILGEVITSF